MPLTCPNGHVNDDANRFCDQCGAQLTAAPASGAADAASAAAAPDAAPASSAPGSLACPTCGQENLPGTAFCENCGAQLPPPQPGQAPSTDAAPTATSQAGGTTCPNCGFDNEPGNSFCEQCGASLAAATAAPVPDAAPVVDESGVSAGVSTDEAALPAPGAQSQPATEEVQMPVDTTTADASLAALPPIPETTAQTTLPPAAEATAPPVTPETPAAPAEPEQAVPPQLAPAAPAAPASPAAAAAPAAQTCSNCGTELPPNARFCLNCGTKVERQVEMVRPTNCQNCGEELPPNAKFCLNCGTKVELIPAGTAKSGAPSSEPTYQQQAAGTTTEGTTAPHVALSQESPEVPTPPEAAADAGGARMYDAEGAAAAAAPVATPPSAPAQSTPVEPAAAQPVPSMPAQPAAPAIQPAQPARTGGGPRLISSDGTTISLPPQSELVIGREDPVSGIHPDIDMTPHGGEAGGVSRRHAVLRQQGGQWTVTDLDSTNYTRVDGNRVAPNTDVPLHDGARVQFGRVHFEFRSQ